jgi:tRNA pseudouridine55 synthase
MNKSNKNSALEGGLCRASVRKRGINGILLLDKPPGLSSNHAMQRVKHIFRAEKAGHAGTLDPMATGLLPIVLGEASKFAQAGLNANKSYEAVMKLGVSTTTADATGEVLRTHSVPDISHEQLIQLQHMFTGPLQQVPPMYSALKKAGVPLYRLARKGETIERAPRSFMVHALTLCKIDQQHIRMQVSCSKGTYIRTLAEDIAQAIDCAAHLVALRRTGVAHLSGPMYSLESLSAIENSDEHLFSTLLPVDILLDQLPIFQLSGKSIHTLFQGKKLLDLKENNVASFFQDQTVRLYTECGHFCGVGVFDSEGSLTSQRLVNSDYLSNLLS